MPVPLKEDFINNHWTIDQRSFLAELSQFFTLLDEYFNEHDKRFIHSYEDEASQVTFQISMVGWNTVYLETIESITFGKGYGGKNFNLFCNIANRHGIKIIFDVHPFDAIHNKENPLSNLNHLMSFYARRGAFEVPTVNEHKSPVMVIIPK